MICPLKPHPSKIWMKMFLSFQVGSTTDDPSPLLRSRLCFLSNQAKQTTKQPGRSSSRHQVWNSFSKLFFHGEWEKKYSLIVLTHYYGTWWIGGSTSLLSSQETPPLTFKTKTDVGSLDRRPETESEFGGFIKKFGDRYNLEGGEVGIEEPFFVALLCLTVPGNAQGRSATKAYIVICSVPALGEPKN